MEKSEKGVKKSRTAILLIFSVFVLVLAVFIISKFIRITEAEEDEKTKLSKLYTLPYLRGHYIPPRELGITHFNTQKAYAGLNLYTSAHAPRAFLMAMNGTELHRWSLDFREVFPELEGVNVWYRQEHWTQFWRRVHLFRNGDLLAIFEGFGMIKIDKDSSLIWATKGDFHHDFEVRGDKIYVLDRRLVTLNRINRKDPVLEDFITLLSAEGEILEKFSILELFENSEFAYLMEGMPPAGDIFHTNTIEIFDGQLANRSSLFKEGNVLISSRMLDTVAIADLEEKKIVWAKKSGLWKTQHQPTLLANGNILLFNNLYINKRADSAEYERLKSTNGYRLLADNAYKDNASSVLEFDPLSMEIIWEYKGDEENSFYSLASGSNQRLPNGNTLITESDRGRVFEVSPEGEIVWEFINTFRTGENKELIATIPELIRFRPGSEFFFDVREK